MHLQTDTHTYIYTNITESRIERDYWLRYAHAARQLGMLILFIAIVTSCHPTLFMQCRVISLSFTEKGSRLLKHLKALIFLASV